VTFCPLCAGLVRSAIFSKALGASNESKQREQSWQHYASGWQRSGEVPNVVSVPPHAEITSGLAAIVASVTTFAATNVDDLFLLSVFFARRESMRRVIAGQYIGFAGIVALSTLGFWAALAIPLAWFRFLGFLPLAIGIKRLLHTRNAEVPVASNFKVLSIAAITLANGGDNLGVYVPFFAVNSAHLGDSRQLHRAIADLVFCREMGGRTTAGFAIPGPLWSLARADRIYWSWSLHSDLVMARCKRRIRGKAGRGLHDSKLGSGHL
jgi:putative Ca2+/H+ antiporter (TMEM165/GDT1 family)